MRAIRILGTRGLPAAHGGFETFAEHLALHLSDTGWKITVYCQEQGTAPIREDQWHGIRRVHVSVNGRGALGTVVFDWKSILHALRESGPVLTLGYNTAVLGALLRLKGYPNLINMDGIEWKRSKWSLPARTWLWVNERLGCWLADQLIADNPGIEDHLATRVARSKITMIPYGSERISDANPSRFAAFDLEAGRFATLIARPEPENSILEVVRAFSARPRGIKLVVLGHYDRLNPFQRSVLDAAGPEVTFAGAIYDRAVLDALRFHSLFYVHGHQVGGTNPSLVEALGAGNPVLAFDNPFNRWVAGEGAVYFSDEASCAAQLEPLVDDEELRARLRQASSVRHAEAFTWDRVHAAYDALLTKWADIAARRVRPRTG